MKIKNYILINIIVPIYKICKSLKYIYQFSLEEMKNDICYPIKLKTYEHSGQGVHPSLLYQPLSDPQFILTFTPYPFSIDVFENPSILISQNGINFYEEKKNLNPLVSTPYKDHNNDPELFYYNNNYNILYLETLRPEKQNIILLTSDDRLLWTYHLIHTDYYNVEIPDPFILSPTFLHSDSSNYLFYVKMNIKESNSIEYIEINENYNFKCRKLININLHNNNPWHISIISYNDTNFMLICCVKKHKLRNKYNLYLAKSNDNINWEFSNNILLSNTYRSTGFIKNDILYIYYSKENVIGAWEIGICKKKIKDFFN